METTRENKSHLTAIHRIQPSVPLRELVRTNHDRFKGRVLDYGCGQGIDVRYLSGRLGEWPCPVAAKIDEVVGYDLHWAPETPEGQFDLVFCQYVLNVIPDAEERKAVQDRVLGFLRPGGSAIIVIRADTKESGYTQRGTWQGSAEECKPDGRFVQFRKNARWHAFVSA